MTIPLQAPVRTPDCPRSTNRAMGIARNAGAASARTPAAAPGTQPRNSRPPELPLIECAADGDRDDSASCEPGPRRPTIRTPFLPSSSHPVRDDCARRVGSNLLLEGCRDLTGGEAGIRTLDTGVSPYNGLANRRLQPLGHLPTGCSGVVMRRLGNVSVATESAQASRVVFERSLELPFEPRDSNEHRDGDY